MGNALALAYGIVHTLAALVGGVIIGSAMIGCALFVLVPLVVLL